MSWALNDVISKKSIFKSLAGFLIFSCLNHEQSELYFDFGDLSFDDERVARISS